MHATRGRPVGLAAPLAPLGVRDERAVHADLAQHRRRRLAGEGAVALPVAVLGEHADLRAGKRLHAHFERDERRAHDDVDVARELDVAQVAAELRSLRRAFVHLPVAGDQHRHVSTACVCITSATGLPPASASSVCTTIDVRPTWSGRATASTWPALTGRKKFVFDSRVAVPAPSGRLRYAQIAPTLSARLIS